jgi:hypothetical protein
VVYYRLFCHSWNAYNNTTIWFPFIFTFLIHLYLLDNRTDLDVYASFFYHRFGTTKSLFYEQDVFKYYNRPQFARSQEILIPSDGSSITLTYPYGGTILIISFIMLFHYIIFKYRSYIYFYQTFKYCKDIK